jgi:exosortase D (VPLPA-CTERM-specific)
LSHQALTIRASGYKLIKAATEIRLHLIKGLRLSAQVPTHPAPPGDIASWHFSPLGWGVLAIALLAAFIPFAGVLAGLFEVWNLEPEYSHCTLIPIISLFLIWRQRDLLTRMPFQGSWAGVALVIAGLVMWYVAELSTIYVIAQYAFLAVLYGLVLSLAGTQVFLQLRMPLFILLFMIPLPAFFMNTLSLQLQLLSSAIGVAVIRLFGISVFLDGNVIDLGSYKLQVAEACNGLRYLFPLMTLAFIVAYLFRVATWKRILLFFSSIPIAILMNSLRIGLIGVTVEHWGTKMAEGVLHDFEGWVVFMLSTAVLLLLAALLARVGGSQVRLRDVLMLDFGPAPVKSAVNKPRTLPPSFLTATALAAAMACIAFTLPERVEVRPARSSFLEFPLQLDTWQGERTALDPTYLDALKLDDYLLADYHRATGVPVNVWIAYYDSQRKGQSSHSPRSCLPGGGWEFNSFGPHVLRTGSTTLTVNRALLTHGAERELMYYWFQQRGRVVTDEYLVKWYVFRDALTRNRTDGALVRLLVPLGPGMSEAQADGEATDFFGALSRQLSRYVPN